MLQGEQGTWDITVYQTLEEVLRTWESRGDASRSAVLHVGFERRVARNYDDVVARYPGRVLLTPGAKGALPRSFRSSVNSVEVVDDEPIYLALDGWGYAEAEPTADMPQHAIRQFGDWVTGLANANLECQVDLANAGIFNEADYLLLEQNLPSSTRRIVGKYRFDCLCSVADDPTMIARHAPPWLQKTALKDLNLTVRISNVFNKLSINFVGDLMLMTVPDLLELQNFGRKSIKDLVSILNGALEAGPPDERALEVSTSQSLLEAVSTSLESCDPRERDILLRRMGLHTEAETLTEIGERYGVTRERIRQIESKCIKRLIKQEVWDDVLREKLRVILADREFPLPLLGIEALDSWFAGAGRHRHTMRYLIENMTETNAAFLEIGGVEYLSFLNQEGWGALLASAQHLLAGGVQHDWSEDECRRNVDALVPIEAHEFRSLLWEHASRWCQFADDEAGIRKLVAFGRGANQIVEAVLAESLEPVHYSEIPALVDARGGPPIDERRAHSAAAEVGYLFGRGRYGTLSHLIAARSEWEAIADEAAEIIGDGPPDRQWHTSEILHALAERGVSLPEGFDKYQLDVALKARGDLHALGRMVWSTCSQNARLDIRQAVIAIIQQAGEPLSTSEIRQRLIAVRGINLGMQLHATDPLIKLDTQTWGLNDRDLRIKRPDQFAFLSRVIDYIRSVGRPISAAECALTFGNEMPTRAIFCLAHNDERLEVTHDRRLKIVEASRVAEDVYGHISSVTD